jgi:hypothetical protein
MAGASFADYERTYREIHGGKGVMPKSARNLEQEYRERQAALRARETATAQAAQERPKTPLGAEMVTDILTDPAKTMTKDPLITAAAGAILAGAMAEAKGKDQETAEAATPDEVPAAPAGVEPSGGIERDQDTAKGRARAVDDFFYKQEGYSVLNCGCGAVLKVPPGFMATQVKCPHCGRKHDISMFREYEADHDS